MAFGNRFTAVNADVVYRVNLGQFRAENAEAVRVHEQGLRQMSTAALKTALAEDKLNVALAKHGANSRQAARAELELRRVHEQVAASTKLETSALLGEERAMGRLTRGAIAGSGALKGLGRALAFSSAGFLGGAGLVYAIRTSIKAAEDHQVAQKQLQAALKAAGLQYEDYAARIDDTLRRQRLLTGFTEDDTVKSFTLLVRNTKDVNEALRLNALAADLARGRNLSLQQASVLVTKAAAGNATSLKRLGIEIHKGATATQILTVLQQRFAGSAVAYGKTAAGAQARFTQAVRETEVAIGTALLPTLTRLTNKAAGWLSQSKNQARVQRDVRDAVHDVAVVMHGLGDTVRTVNKITGGFTNTLKVILALKLASVINGWGKALGVFGTRATTSFATLAASSSAAEAKVIADAAKMDAALDAATRPRNILITETVAGGGLPGGGGILGGGGGGTGGGGVAGRINQYGRNPVPATEPTAPGFNLPGGLIGFFVSGFAAGSAAGEVQKMGRAAWDEKTDQFYVVFTNPGGDTHRSKISRADAMKLDAAFVKRVDAYKAAKKRRTQTAGVTTQAPVNRGANPPPAPTPPLDRATAIQLQLSRTAGQTGAARINALQTQIGFDDKYIRIQERLLRTDVKNRKQHATILERLYADRQSAQSEIDSINQQAANKAAEAQRKANAAQRKAQHRQKQLDEIALRDWIKYARDNAEIGRAFDSTLRPGALNDPRKRAANAKSAAARSAAHVVINHQANIAEFLQQFASLQAFRGNYWGGSADTHLYEIKHDQRRQTALLASAVSRNSYPASSYHTAAAFGAFG